MTAYHYPSITARRQRSRVNMTISLCSQVEPLSFRGRGFLQRASEQSEDRAGNEHSKIQNNPGERLAAVWQRMLTWRNTYFSAKARVHRRQQHSSIRTDSISQSNAGPWVFSPCNPTQLEQFCTDRGKSGVQLYPHTQNSNAVIAVKDYLQRFVQSVDCCQKIWTCMRAKNNLSILQELLWERADQNANCRLALGWWSRCQPSLKYRQKITCNTSATGLWVHCEAGSLMELWVWFPLETLTYKTEPVLLPSTARWLTLTNQMRTETETGRSDEAP